VRGRERGQALVLLLAAIAAVAAGAVVLGWLAAGLAAHAARQRAADLAALAGARALLDARPRLAERGPRRLTAAGYLALARATARRTAQRNGAHAVAVTFGPGALPGRVRVVVRDVLRVPGAAAVSDHASAVAEVSQTALAPIGDGAYRGPFALRQGKPMRPDVALAFDRLDAAARRAGVPLTIVSAFRSDREQARLFAAHPDPRWVAPPGRSLHRLGTELDLGPPAAYGWLRVHAGAYGFVRRYPWEPWHFGLGRNPGSASVGFAPASGGAASAVPPYVPRALAGPLRAASRRWSVGAALLAAQLQQESGFDARARSPAGALGIAQFMPATARAYGLADPFDPRASIDAQAHLMHNLLRRFGSVPLALAAYNAGAGAVAACWCVPGIAETQGYVQRIVALARGGGLGAGGGGPLVRLVA